MQHIPDRSILPPWVPELIALIGTSIPAGADLEAAVVSHDQLAHNPAALKLAKAIQFALSTAPHTVSHKYLTVREAAKKIGVSESTLNKLRCEGGGPEYHRFGGRVLYREDTLDAFMQKEVYFNTADADRRRPDLHGKAPAKAGERRNTPSASARLQ